MNKKNYTKVRGAYALMLFLFISHMFVGWRNAPPPGRTGAPGEGKCTDCHGGNNPQGLDGNMQITGLPIEVMPNTTYRVSVEIANPNGLSRDAGMQMVALTSANQNAGSFANPSAGARINVANNSGRNYLEHNPALPYDANRVATFSVDWTSPADPDPMVTFYAVGNITDMDAGSGTSNDLILFGTETTEVAGNVMMDLPDLTASDVVNFGGTYAPDEVAEFSWDLNNIGNAVAVNGYRIGMYLSSDTQFSADDAFVGEVPTGNTFPGTIAGVPGAIRVPLNYPDGEYYMHLVVDVDNTVEESNEDNNVYTTSTTIMVETQVVEPILVNLTSMLDCDGTGVISAQASGGVMPYVYAWSTGEMTPTIDIATDGLYTVTITDDANTAVVDMLEVNFPNSLVGDILIDQMPGCGGLGAAEIIADGGTLPYTYEWPDGTNERINSALMAGDYVVTVTDAIGCTLELSISLTNTSELQITSSVQQLTCSDVDDAEIALELTGGSGNYTFNWSNMQTTSTIAGLAGGIYNVTVDDGLGCSVMASFTITTINPIELVDNITAANCGALDGSINVLAIGGAGPYDYLWSNGAQTNTISNIGGGDYTVTVTDRNDCTMEATYTVGGGAALTLQTRIENVNCFGISDGALFVEEVMGGVGPYTYAWSNGVDGANNPGLEAGVYTVTVTDTNSGCATEASYTVAEPAVLQMQTSIQNVSCFGGSDGSIAIVGMLGGVPPYTFMWNNGIATPSSDGLQAGVYTISITDGNACSMVQAIEISQPDELIATANVQEDTGNGGRIDLAVTGGTSPYTYAWSNGATTQNIAGLSTGSYSVEVTDANGCKYNDSFEIISTSTQTIAALSSWEIYPSPAQDFIMVDAVFDAAVPVTMRILSLDGRYLETVMQDFDFAASQQNNRIDISHLDQGIYLFLLESEQGRAVKRFIKI